MEKKINFLLILSLVISISNIQAKHPQASMNTFNECSTNQKNKQQNFIAYNGMLGIYQPTLRKAHIDNNTYSKVKSILKQSDKKIKKPWNSMFLGTLIDGENEYELYGKKIDDTPINTRPDADVRTEQKLAEDFMRGFGSGKYTQNDLWD